MIELAKYPYIPGKKGLPLDQLEAPFADFVEAGDGRSYFVEMRPDEISIERGSGIFGRLLHAVVESNGVLSLDVKTVNLLGGWKILRDPNLYAGRFVDFAMRHFDREQTEIIDFRDQWNPGSTNRTAYDHIFALTGDKVLAAQSTWSGKVMGRHGFIIPDPDNVQVEGVCIATHFVRSNQR